MRKKLLMAVFSCLLLLNIPVLTQARSKTIVIDDFSSAKVGTGRPKGWELKETKGKSSIKVEIENGNKVLRMNSNGTSFALNKELEIDLEKYPIVTWRWKVNALPKGGDIRSKDKDDQAAQIYMHFAKFPKTVNFWEVGYIWDSSAPKGGTFPSPQIIGDRVQYIVMQSGTAKLGQWIEERRNLYQDHKKLFGEEPPELQGIGIMLDSDNTKSTAEFYIDDIVFHQR